MSATYVVGIDLGTTNSALAYAALDDDRAQPQSLPVPQLVAPGTVESRALLPSFMYLAQAAECASGALTLPWSKRAEFAVGEWARRQSAESPDRTVSAAKSWLCHSRVDRRAAILPWQAPADVPRVSPLNATQRYLEHLASAWDAAFPKSRLAAQHVVLTVPASFDANARELTREAALAAGLPESLVLLEEPQAALYAWLNAQGERWRKNLKVGDVLLVVDVGGGTTDLSLVAVAEEQGELALQRMAVGPHLLVGGDNMDLALAHFAAGKFAEQGAQLDAWQSVSLWHACRAAKELLFAADGPARHTLTVKGRGSKMLKSALSLELQREAVAELLVQGFWPASKLDDRPTRQRQSGFQEIGLPYEADTAITRHVAQFLSQQGATPARPTHVLFNGGVFKSTAFRERMLSALGDWFADRPPQHLAGEVDLDLAVARGAAAYGWAKQRGGVRIRGGTARAYYVGLETSGPAVPGMPRPLRALCVAPHGMEEGTSVEVPGGEIGLVVGESARFRFFSSATRKTDRPGDLVSRWTDDELVETAPLEAHLPKTDALPEAYVPVRFQAHLTELGMLELWCHGTRTNDRWKLEFKAREE